MNYDLDSIDRTQFNVVPHIIAGDNCFLVAPLRMGVDWTQQNKVLRSSVWNSDGELVSAGFAKFVNWGEKPDVFPVPTSLKNAVVVDKLDGSLLIVSKYKGQFILRTRGTVDASKLDNGCEVEVFKEKHSLVLRHDYSDTWDHSMLFEWCTPSNKIILDYGPTPTWKLVGLVHHDDYSLAGQDTLDFIANQLDLQRPETFTFSTVKELIASVEQWKGKEGVCIYSNGGQEIHKVKGFEYRKLHQFKEHATLKNTVDLFVDYGYPSYDEFKTKLVETFDFESFEMVSGFIPIVVDAFKSVKEIESSMVRFLEPLKPLSRKEAAQKIISDYSTTNRTSYCFQLLDSKELDKDALKKLLYQVMKK